MQIFIYLALFLGLASYLLYKIVNDLFEYSTHRRKGTKAEEEKGQYELTEYQKQNGFCVKAKEWFDNFDKQDVSIKSNDGFLLKGNFFENKDSDKACLVIPGWTDKKEYMFMEVMLMYELGYNVLVPDTRAQGQSEGEYVCFGSKEKDDMSLWLKILSGKGFEKIAVYGRSMGAATAMLTACFERDTKILCVVEDSGYTSFEEQSFSFIKSKMRWLPNLVVKWLMLWLRKYTLKHADFALETASPISYISNCDIPMLFIHGKDDTFVPYEMINDLYDAHKGPKERLDVDGAKHVCSIFVDTDKYKETVKQFLNKYIN